MRLLIACLSTIVIALAAACGGGGGDDAPQPTRTPRPLPAAVDYAAEPDGATYGDPSFDALPGAEADFGRLGGSTYQIEIPADWNGDLVLFLHGFHNFAPTLEVDQPAIRSYLIRNGYAWAASSFSSNSLVPGLAADETAALWDYFAVEFGRPRRTYITGQSMGGGAVQIAAERYPERFAGGLGLCGIAGNSAELNYLGDFFVAAAYVSGLTQADYDASSADALIAERIAPALAETATRDRLVDIVIDLTGGPRAFDREATIAQISSNFQFVELSIPAGLYGNPDTVYELGPLSSVTSEEFNAGAIRVDAGDAFTVFTDGNDPTGVLLMPLLTLHTTGDFFVPISQQQTYADAVEAAEKSHFLVQRAVQSPGHCTFTNTEWENGFEDLVEWVRGDEPDAEDIRAADLTTLGADFTSAPRLGSPEADAAPGADERLSITGTLTMDGAPFNDFVLGVIVRRDGLEAMCAFTSFSPVDNGSYSLTAASDTEVHGCGTPGAQIYVSAFDSESRERVFSQELASWPDGTELTFDASFSSADPAGVSLPVTELTGTLLDDDEAPFRPGTAFEAYIGETLCGVASLPHIVMGNVDTETYRLRVAGPVAVPGCEAGAEITFLVNGNETRGTQVNDLASEQRTLDLTLDDND